MAGVSVTIQEVNDVDSGSSSTRLLRALSVSTSVECILDIFIVLEVAGITEETVFDTITTSMTSTTTALQSNFHTKVEGVKNTTLSVTIDSIVSDSDMIISILHSSNPTSTPTLTPSTSASGTGTGLGTVYLIIIICGVVLLLILILVLLINMGIVDPSLLYMCLNTVDLNRKVNVETSVNVNVNKNDKEMDLEMEMESVCVDPHQHQDRKAEMSVGVGIGIDIGRDADADVGGDVGGYHKIRQIDQTDRTSVQLGLNVDVECKSEMEMEGEGAVAVVVYQSVNELETAL